MKLLKISILSVLLFLIMSCKAEAALIDLGNGIIKDDVNNQFWYKNLREIALFSSWSELNNLIDSLNNNDDFKSNDIGTWYWAKSEDMSLLRSHSPEEISSVFTPSRIAWNTIYYLGGYDEHSPYQSDPTYRYYWGYKFDKETNDLISQSSGSSYHPTPYNDNIGAWITAKEIPTPVPEPTSILLGLLGLGGAVSLKRRFG